MSGYSPFEGDGPPEGSPEDLGGATGDGQPADQIVEEPKAYLEVDEVADRYVRVKVDGEELEVPLREALQGYSRTADYTRKTQALAAQRQQTEYALAVQRALQARPKETLQLLAGEYGIELGQSPPPSWREQPSYYDDGLDDVPTPSDPVAQRLAQQEQRLAQVSQQLAQRSANETLQAAIGGLQRKYQADDATVREVVSSALQAGMGPESFDMIYKNLAFDRAQAARAAAQQDRAEQARRRENAKAQSQQLVGSERSAASAGGRAPASGGPVSLAAAFNEAWDEVQGR